MESYGNDMFLSQEGYPSIDFTLLDRPSTSVASAPEFTAPLLPDSSFPSLDFLDGSGIDSLGGVLRNAEEAHFHGHGRPELHKDIDWRKEKTLHASPANIYIQGGENPEPKSSSSQLHIPVPVPQGNFFSAKQSGSDNLQAQLSTSGNRVGDEVHDFFEQEHLSQQQSQLDKSNWSVVNNNAWPDDSQNNESRHIHQSLYNTEPNTQPDDGIHSSRMALGVRSPQEGPNNNVLKSQSRNQPLIFDSLLNGSSAGHIRSNQATSAGDGGTPERNQSSTGSLAGPDIQQGHIVGQGSNHSRNSSEGVENVEARVNYDFLGSQLLLKGQPQAVPQYHGPRLQQPGLDEAQLWKQFMYQKHLQELHRNQQIPQIEQHARQQQAQQLEQQARQPHAQQLGQQVRQPQAELLEQSVRRQQVQQLVQQARRQQAQQLEHQVRQQQAQQLQQQARQQQAQQLEQQARQQQAQLLEHHARQQQAQQLEQHARQQQAQQLEQHSRQQQLQQLLVGDKQNLGNQFSPSPYGSSMHNVSNFMHSGSLMSQMAIESHNPSLLPGNLHQINAGSMNGMLNCSPSLPGIPTEALLSQDPYLAWQAMTLMGAHLDPSVYGSSTSNTRDSAGQPLNLYPSSQGGVQELADAVNKSSAANHQVGKPVVRTPVLGASVLGNHRTSSFDPMSAENDGKQKALNKSLFGQSFPQNFPQPSETTQGISNFPQGTAISRNSQVQDFHLNQQHRSWTEEIGQKENFQGGPSQVLVNSDAPSESGFYTSQPSGWHAVHPAQVVASSDSRIQNMNAGQYVHQGSYQMGNADIFNSIASKPQGSWSALMQSAVAESPSGDADQDDWSSLSLQKTEPASSDYLHPNPKQQSIWSEQNVPVSNSMNGRSFHLLNNASSQLGVQNVQGLQQSGSEVGSLLESKLVNIQHNNQIKLQPGSSQFLQETPRQASGLQEQTLYQPSDNSRNIHSHSNFDDQHQNTWKSQDIEQVPSDGRVSSHYMNFDGRQQFNSLGDQGNSKVTESDRIFHLTSKEQSCWSKNEAQGTEQNNILVNANKGHDKNENDNIMHLEREQLGSHVQKGEDQTYQTRNEVNRDTAARFQHQDPNVNSCQNGQQLMQQEGFHMGRFPRNSNADNLENNAERYEQTPESNYQLNSNNAILDSYAKNRRVGNTSVYQQGNSSLALNPFPNISDRSQRYTNDINRSQYSQNDCTSAGQIAGKGDPNQSAKAGSDYTGKSPQREDDLQSLSNMNHLGYSRLSKMSTGTGESSGNDMLRMPPRHMLQQAVGMVSMNQWHAESVKQDSSLRGTGHLDSQGQKAPEQQDFVQSKVVRTVSLNSTMNAGKDDLNTNLQTNFRDFSTVYPSVNPAVFDSSTNICGSNKPASLSSQNVLDLLSKPDNPNESDTLKRNICSEQNASVDPCESSSPDVSLTHFGHNQSSGPLSPQGFGLRLAPPAQLLQRMQGRPLQTSASMQTANVINDRQTHSSKGESAQKSVALSSHQDSLSKVSDPATAEGISSHVTTSPKPLNVPSELSPTSLKENAVKLDKPPYAASSDIHPSTQLQYIQHSNAAGQLISIPQSVVPRAVTQRQANLQGNMISTHQLQGSHDVAVAGQLTPTCHSATPSTVSSVNAVIERETEMQGSLVPSTRPFSQINYQNALLVQDGLGRSHHFMPVNSNLSGPRNSDQGLQESQSDSVHHLPGPSGRPQTAEFSKLLNALKTTLANRQRMSMGAEKVLPSSFDSYRSSMGGPGNNFQSFLPSSESQMKFSMVGKPTTSFHGQMVRPSTINSQQPPSAGELSKQESSFQQMASDRAESSASPGPQASAMVTLPHQAFAANPQLSMLQSQGQDQRNFLLSKIHSGAATSVASPFQSSISTHIQEQSKPTSGQDSQSQVNLRSACPPTQQQSDSCSDDPVESQASEPSDALHHQYISSSRKSPMTTMQTDFDRQAVKRLKTADAGSGGIDPSMKAKSIDQTVNPHYGMGQFKIATTTRSAQQQVSFPVDARMLPSSQGIKERREEASNQGMVSIVQNRLQNQGYNHNIYGSSQSSSGAGDRNHFNPQNLNPRLLQFGPNTPTNEKLLALQLAAMYKRLGESGRSGTLTSQQIPPGRNVEHLFPGSGLAPTITSHTNQSDLKEVESAVPVGNSTAVSMPIMEGHTANQHQYYLSKANIGAPVRVLPNKRKKVMSRLIPWHVDITQAGGHLPTTSDAELAWASSTNRLTEKEEDEIDNQEEGTGSVPQVKRRLKLTTQLMQQLIPPIPAAVVRGKAIMEYENATYTLAKTALRDACKLVSNSRKDMGKKVENENLALGQLQKPKRLKGNSALRIAESFMDRAKNLEDEFLRLEASSSMTELRSDTQHLESLSIVNRLVKHHGRNLPVDHSKVIIEERESSSDSAFCNRKLCPQRYVTAVPMPRNLPEGVLCFSL